MSGPAPRAIVVGEMSNGMPHEVFGSGSSASRLDKVLPPGWTGKLDRVNLLAKSSRGWDFLAARSAARMLLLSRGELRRGGLMILCGERVARAFKPHAPYADGEEREVAHLRCREWLLRIADHNGKWIMTRALLIPHPSGRCRDWNDLRCEPHVRQDVLNFLRA